MTPPSAAMMKILPFDANDANFCFVEMAERFAGDHLVERTNGRLTARDIEHPIHDPEQRVHIMSGK